MKVIDPHKQSFSKPLIMTFTGKMVNPFELRNEDIDPIDIAHSLAQQVRYTGHLRKRVSIAEHCVLLHDYIQVLGEPDPVCCRMLMHDSDEAYFIDLPAPIKHWANGFGDKFREAAALVTTAVVKRFDLIDPEPPIIKQLDVQMREVEILDGFPKDEDREYSYGDLLPIRIRHWTDTEAEFEFLCRLEYHGLVKRDWRGNWIPT